MNTQGDLKKLGKLIQNRCYEEALELCDLLLMKASNGEHLDLLRKRSHIHSLLGDYPSAINDRLELIGQTQEVADYFFASLYFIRAEKFKEAYRTINEGISSLADSAHTPYTDELIFLRAYALVKLGLYQQAEEACESIKDDMEMWVSNYSTPTSKNQLKEWIKMKSQD